MLYTNLNHLDTATWYTDHVCANENVLLVCGSMNPKSVQMYRMLEGLKVSYRQVEFFDMECDNPDLNITEKFPADKSLADFPLIICYKYGNVLEVSNSTNISKVSAMLKKLVSTKQ